MSTSGAVGFVLNGNITILFNNMDSQPSCLGEDVLDFVRRWGINRIAYMVSNFIYTDDDLGGDNFYALDDYLMENKKKDAANKGLSVHNDINFVHNSLFCEWLYLIDLDGGNLEVFKGFNEEKPKGRFSEVPPRESGYNAVTLVRTIPLNDLPPRFVNKEF